jgi:hypothetical protein
MGGSASIEVKKAAEKVNQLLQIMTTKRDYFIAEIESKRGLGNTSLTEVCGGRTVMRQSEVRVSTGSGVDKEIEDAMSDFMDCAQGGAQVKQKAISGGKKLIKAGLDAVFGASEGQGCTKVGFVCMFMNYAFVRIDYYVHSFTAKGKKWGEANGESGSCFVTDLAVLDPATLTSSETDFLLAQALCGPDSRNEAQQLDRIRRGTGAEIVGQGVQKRTSSGAAKDIAIINQMKILLQFSCLMSAKIKQAATLEEIERISEKLSSTMVKVREAFDQLENYTPLPKQ